MSGKRSVILNSFKITGEPDFWHRIWDYIPFWQGSDQKFILIIEALGNTSANKDFQYTIEYGINLTYVLYDLEIPDMKQGEKITLALEPIPLLHTGDSWLIVTRVNPQFFHRVYSFNVTNRSWLFLALFAGLLAGLFSALLNFILT